MKNAPSGASGRAVILTCATLCAIAPLHAAKTWTGSADATWANTANWLEGALPEATEGIVFDVNSASNLTIDTGVNRTVLGISLSNPAGPVTIQNNVLTIGSAGIDVSAATQNLSLASPNNVLHSGAFQWSPPAGRTLTFAAVPHRNSPNGGFGGGNNDNVGGVVRVSSTSGGTVNLTTPNLLVVTDSVAGQGGGNNPYMTYGDAAFAATDASGNVIAATNVPWSASVGATFSGSPGAVAGSFTQNGNGGFQGIVFDDAAAAHTVTLQGSTTFTGRALLMAPGCLGGTIAGGFLRPNRSSTAGATFSIIQNSTAGDLTLSSSLSNASSGAPVSVTKSGPGKLVLTANHGYSGRTFLHEGTLQLGDGVTTGNLTSTAHVINNAALIVNNPTASALTAVISGTGPITKAGAGVLTFGNANTYTGTTTVNGGLIGIGAVASLGATPALNLDGGGIQWSAEADISALPVTFGPAGATFDTNGVAVSLASSLGNSGTGPLVKAGAGVLTLGGSNLYSGGTTVSGGKLIAANTTGSATGSGPVTVQTGAGIGGTGTLAGTVTVESEAGIAPGAGVGTLTVGGLDLDFGSTLAIEFGTGNDQIAVSTSGALTIDGGAVTLLQDGTVNPFAAVGTYNLIAYSGAIGGAGASSLSVANPQPGFSYNFGTSGGFVTLTIGTSGVVRNWLTDGDGSWINNTNWNGTFPNATGAIANFHTGLSGPATVTLDGSKTLGGITFLSPLHGYTIAAGSGGSLILNNGASQASILDSAGTHTISAPVTLTSDTVVNTAAAEDGMILSGAVSGNGSLTKTGPGSLDLLATNSFLGDLTLSGGTTTFVNGGLGAGDLSLASSTLVWAPGNTEDISNRVVSFTSGTIGFDVDTNDVVLANTVGNFGVADFVKSGAGKLTLAADADFLGLTTIAEGTLQLGNGGTTGALQGDIVNNGELRISRSGDILFTSLVSGTGSLVHDGPGNLQVVASNTFTGTTTINAGSIALFNGLGLQGSTLLYNDGGGTLDFDLSGAVTLGALEGNKDLTLTNIVPGPVALTVGANGADTIYTGVLSGDGSLTKTGAGVMTLGAVHTYTGATAVNGGTLELPSGSITTTSANVGVGGQLLVTGGSLTSSAFSTYQSGGVAIQLESGSIAFNGGVQSSQNDGSVALINGGNFSALDLIIRRTRNYGTGVDPSATVGTEGIVVNPGGTATIANTFQVGTGNSGAGALVNGGDMSVAGVVTVGNTTNTRWSVFEVRGGTFTASEATEGLLLSPHATTANRAQFLVSGGTATVERIGFGTATAAAGTGRVTVNAGALYVGAGGLVQDAPVFTSEVQLLGGTLAAKANWSSSLPVSTANLFIIQTADASSVPFDITLSGAVGGTGSLVKTGGGTLTLGGSNSYTGNTGIEAGTLVVDTATLSDTGNVEISTGATLNLPHGQIDTVAAFLVDGVPQGSGTFTATTHPGLITGSGSILVDQSDPFSDWMANFPTLTGPDAEKSADPDQDGMTNFEEFAFDGEADSGIASGKIRSRIQTVGDEQALVLTLPVRNDAAFDAVPGPGQDATIDSVVYAIQGSNDLDNFDQGVTEIPADTTGLPTLRDGWTYRAFRLDGAIGGASTRGPKGFIIATATEEAP